MLIGPMCSVLALPTHPAPRRHYEAATFHMWAAQGDSWLDAIITELHLLEGKPPEDKRTS